MSEANGMMIHQELKNRIKQTIVGQDSVITQLIAAFLAQGHVLLEGVPGIGKTLLVKALSEATALEFKRIQFTPDLMPADIVGTTVFRRETGDFYVRKGPVFTSFLLSDEINRAPGRTQAALLQAMQETQVTIDGTDHALDECFFVAATQNPVEMEGTYPLPEAQLDRFLMKIIIGYPGAEHELELLRRSEAGFRAFSFEKNKPVVTRKDIIAARKQIAQVKAGDKILSYINDITQATRNHQGVSLGVSGRGMIALLSCARTMAFLDGRDYVKPDDVKPMVYPVYRHRMILDPEAELQNLKPDGILSSILEGIEVPR
jgi:MoxR-like ATPase